MTAKTMRTRVDPDACQGHNRCKALAAGDGSVASDEPEKARLAAANCPEFAIEIIEE